MAGSRPAPVRAYQGQHAASGEPSCRRQLGETILTASGKTLCCFCGIAGTRFPPLFNRYQGGQSFGTTWTMPFGSHRNRTPDSHRSFGDLFFSRPDEYEGGELIVEDTYGLHHVKLPAGHMILYPSTSLHHVTRVTRGSRLSSFSGSKAWSVTTTAHLAVDLDTAIQRLNPTKPDDSAVVQLTGVYHTCSALGGD